MPRRDRRARATARQRRRGGLLLLFAILACYLLLTVGWTSGYDAGAEQHLAQAYTQESILLIFNHGSKRSGEPDFCEPNGRSTPNVIKQLHGERVGNKPIVVYELCTASVGIAGQLGSKNDGRVREIEQAILAFQRRGVPAEHIFLAGQSAGGWASLMIARRNAVDFNAIIAFAPANSGKKAHRTAVDTQRLTQLTRYLSDTPYLQALVYAFEHDEYNDTSTLAFLRDVRGVEFMALDDQAIDGIPCSPNSSAHMTAFKHCFTVTQKRVILEYIVRRVLTPNS